MFVISYAAGLSEGTTSEVPGLDQAVPASGESFQWGDMNCDDAVNALDAHFLFAYKGDIALTQQPNCVPIGQPLA